MLLFQIARIPVPVHGEFRNAPLQEGEFRDDQTKGVTRETPKEERLCDKENDQIKHSPWKMVVERRYFVGAFGFRPFL